MKWFPQSGFILFWSADFSAKYYRKVQSKCIAFLFTKDFSGKPEMYSSLSCILVEGISYICNSLSISPEPINPLQPFLFDIDSLSISLDLLGNPAFILNLFVTLLSMTNYFNGKLTLPQLTSRHLLLSRIVIMNSQRINIF